MHAAGSSLGNDFFFKEITSLAVQNATSFVKVFFLSVNKVIYFKVSNDFSVYCKKKKKLMLQKSPIHFSNINENARKNAWNSKSK